jgi:hypothetical protein
VRLRAHASVHKPGSLENVGQLLPVIPRIDGLAAGSNCIPNCAQSGTLLLHRNGKTWSKTPSPNPGPKGNFLTGVGAVSPADAWTVGQYCNVPVSACQMLTLRWNGTTWSQVPSPSPGTGDSLGDVAASATANAWAVGCANCFTAPGAHALIEHWNGTAWSTTPG